MGNFFITCHRLGSAVKKHQALTVYAVCWVEYCCCCCVSQPAGGSPLPRVVFCVQSPQDLLLVISKAAIVSGQFSLGQDPELAIDSIGSTEISGNSVGGSSQQAIHKCFVM
jgi:hypothetical protein